MELQDIKAMADEITRKRREQRDILEGKAKGDKVIAAALDEAYSDGLSLSRHVGKYWRRMYEMQSNPSLGFRGPRHRGIILGTRGRRMR